MPSNLLLLLPLLGGYLFSHLFHYTRFRAQALQGHRLVFEAAIAGVLFLAPARGLVFWLMKQDWLSPLLGAWPSVTNRTAFAGTTILAVLLAPTAATLLNLGYGWWHQRRDVADSAGGPRSWWRASKVQALDVAIRHFGNVLQQLLHQAAKLAKHGDPVGLSLHSGKLYLALVKQSPTLSPNDQQVSVVPLMSGYRDPESWKPVYNYLYQRSDFTHSVVSQSEEKDPGDVQHLLSIPLSEIVSIHQLEKEHFLSRLKDLGRTEAEHPREAPSGPALR